MRSWWKSPEPIKESGRHWDGSIVYDVLHAPPRAPGRHRRCENGQTGSRGLFGRKPSETVWITRRDIRSGKPCEIEECTVCHPPAVIYDPWPGKPLTKSYPHARCMQCGMKREGLVVPVRYCSPACKINAGKGVTPWVGQHYV